MYTEINGEFGMVHYGTILIWYARICMMYLWYGTIEFVHCSCHHRLLMEKYHAWVLPPVHLSEHDYFSVHLIAYIPNLLLNQIIHRGTSVVPSVAALEVHQYHTHL